MKTTQYQFRRSIKKAKILHPKTKEDCKHKRKIISIDQYKTVSTKKHRHSIENMKED